MLESQYLQALRRYKEINEKDKSVIHLPRQGLWNIRQNELEWGQNGKLFDSHHGLKLRKNYE